MSCILGGLVANGEALPLVLRILEFVDEGDRVVLEGNTAVALCVGDEVVFAQDGIFLCVHPAQRIRLG